VLTVANITIIGTDTETIVTQPPEVRVVTAGTKGYSGFSGPSGYSGYSGPSGYSGFTGFSGISGFSGNASGYSGFTGLSGFSGFSGKSGYSGYSGVGTSGFSGFSGAGQSGYSGFSGPSGYSGFSSTSGYSGFSGPSGYSGFTGNSGYSGFTGVSGYSGFSGTAGAGSTALSSITAATGSNSINSGTNQQTWNWSLTGVGAGTFAMTFGENSASSGGDDFGSQAIVAIKTLSTSTAIPLYIQNVGAAYSFRVDDQTSDGTPFVVDSAGRTAVSTTDFTDWGPNDSDNNTQFVVETNSSSGTLGANPAAVIRNINTTNNNHVLFGFAGQETNSVIGAFLDAQFRTHANPYITTDLILGTAVHGSPSREVTRWTGEGWQINQNGEYFVSSQFDKVNATLADVTGLSASVTASKTYRFEALLFVDADATGGGKYAIAGSATATAIKYNIDAINNSTNAFVINSRQTALAGSAGQAGATSLEVVIRGTITVNAAGTLTVQFAQNTANGTSSVLTMSRFVVWEMN